MLKVEIHSKYVTRCTFLNTYDKTYPYKVRFWRAMPYGNYYARAIFVYEIECIENVNSREIEC